MTEHAPLRIAAVQASPVFLDREATIAKACALIAEAGAAGARFVVFPEGFVPTYPLWTWFLAPNRTRELRALYAELLENAVDVPGDATAAIAAAAKAAGVAVVLGVNERNVEASGTSLYNSILFFAQDGALLGKRRKLVPTSAERLVHAQGDGSTLVSFQLPFGRVSGLICWESYMPLARYALYAEGVEILAAPTWDRGEPWTSTLRHVAKEGRCFVVGCVSPVRRSDIPERYSALREALPAGEWINPGGSAIVDPDGKFLVEPVVEREAILYADADLARFRGARFQLDVAGHYARPDVFRLLVDRRPRPLVESVADPES